jgi:hypothetical protein
VSLATAASSVAQAHGKEHQVSIDQIPPAAKSSLQREANGAEIRRVEVETKDQKTVYEGVVMQGNAEVGIMVDGDGRVLGRHPEKDETGEKNPKQHRGGEGVD